MGQEIFGPILPVLGFDDADEVRRIVARNPEPLALYVFTRDPSFSEGIFSSIRFGGGCVNNVVIHLANPRVPFGGVGNSGMGNYHGERGFAAFSDERTIARSGAFSANTLVFPPYGARKERLVDRL
jgi:aldehyde dehydrogenase (NAD+)